MLGLAAPAALGDAGHQTPVPAEPGGSPGRPDPGVPRQLPRTVGNFVGRAAELSAPDGLLDEAANVPGTLPGSRGCMVVITSRSELTGLVCADGARPLGLDVLTVAEAHQLLAARLGAARLTAEPAAAAELVARCAQLPLALAITAARDSRSLRSPPNCAMPAPASTRSDCYQNALSLFRELGDRFNEAEILTHLGDARHAAHHHQQARESWHQALEILDDLHHRDADQVRRKLEQLGTDAIRSS